MKNTRTLIYSLFILGALALVILPGFLKYLDRKESISQKHLHTEQPFHPDNADNHDKDSKSIGKESFLKDTEEEDQEDGGNALVPAPSLKKIESDIISEVPPLGEAELEAPSPALDPQATFPTPSLAPTPTPETSEEASESAGLEALREVQTLGTGGDQFGAGMRRKSSTQATSSLQTETVQPTPTAKSSTKDSKGLLTGQARGYTMLYLMHPKARATVEKQLEILIRANIREVYLGVLVDGTFFLDFNYLASVLRRLNSAQRIITLVVYFSNGSTMRNFDRSPIRAGFNIIEPLFFRELIQSDRGIRDDFITILSRARPVIDLNHKLNPENKTVAIVMLEDNLDKESYRAMRNLAFSVLRNSVEFARNACPGCYAGNDDDSLGDALEYHAPRDMAELGPRDGYSLDGLSYVFPGEARSRELTIDDVLRLADGAMQRKLRYFGLWRAQRQGIQGELLHPDDRDYEVPTEDQAQVEIQMLREGLNPVLEEGEAEGEADN